MTAHAKSDPSLIEPHEFLTDEFRINPFPIYQRLREYDPVYQDKFQNRWIISRYEDIRAIYKDNNRFTRAVYNPHGKFKFGSDTTLGQTLNELGEGNDYIWLRGLVAGEFVGKRLEKRIPLIEQTAHKIIQEFMATAREDQRAGHTVTGQVELVSQFSARFPIRVIAGMLGLPEEDNSYFEAVYDRIFAGGGYGREHFRQGVAARDELFAYLDPLLDDRLVNPREDLLSTFCHAEKDGEKMSREQMRGYVALLLVGGGDTTHKAIDAMWWNLLRNPEQYELVRENPELMDRVFTEMLRFDGSNHWQRRRTKVEVEIGDKVLPVGATAWLGLGSGNRDEQVFNEPDTFNIFRNDLYFGKELRTGYWSENCASHLGFGQETHFCMGYALARQEAVVASCMLMDALKNPRLADVPNEGIAFPPPGRGGVRGLQHLEIEFDIF
ncbi:MAG: hypothetical protein CL897_00205 [Dehalococcoidia bacterium]|nr:hypothetical protein [Dehalococcoidia bacterium]|tara:strand:- start:27991 stop:29307 length:1317 start_codon:yes stop_codon:yes gene_type:complete